MFKIIVSHCVLCIEITKLFVSVFAKICTISQAYHVVYLYYINIVTIAVDVAKYCLHCN